MISRTSVISSLLTFALILDFTSSSIAQQPKDPPKYPPINPAQARLEQTFTGLDGPGFAVAASEPAQIIAAACERGTIHFWHKDSLFGIRDGSGTANVLGGHAGTVLDLAWNGGHILASVGADKKILFWDVLAGKVKHSLDSSYLVRTIAMDPEGKTLAGAGDNGSIQLWEIETGKPARELKGHADWVLSLGFSNDGKHLLSGGYEGQALLWDVGSGNKIRELPAPPKDKPKDPPAPVPVYTVAFSPDGKQALLGRANGEIDQVNAEDGKTIRTWKGHTSAVSGLLYHPTGTLAVSCSKDGSIRLWNPANGTQFKELKEHTAWVEDIALLAEGTRLVSVGADQTVRVWNLTAP